MLLSWTRASVFVAVLGILWGGGVHVIALKCNVGIPGQIAQANCPNKAGDGQDRCATGTLKGVVNYMCFTNAMCASPPADITAVSCCQTDLCNASGAATSTPMVVVMIGTLMCCLYFAML